MGPGKRLFGGAAAAGVDLTDQKQLGASPPCTPTTLAALLKVLALVMKHKLRALTGGAG